MIQSTNPTLPKGTIPIYEIIVASMVFVYPLATIAYAGGYRFGAFILVGVLGTIIAAALMIDSVTTAPGIIANLKGRSCWHWLAHKVEVGRTGDPLAGFVAVGLLSGFWLISAALTPNMVGAYGVNAIKGHGFPNRKPWGRNKNKTQGQAS